MKQHPEHRLIVLPKEPPKTVRGLEKWHLHLFEDAMKFEFERRALRAAIDCLERLNRSTRHALETVEISAADNGSLRGRSSSGRLVTDTAALREMRDAALLGFASQTACREGEMVGATLSQFDLAQRAFIVNAEDRKNDSDLVTHIRPDFAPLFGRYLETYRRYRAAHPEAFPKPEAETPLFPSLPYRAWNGSPTGSFMVDRHVREQFYSLTEAVCGHRHSPHTFRRGWATEAARHNVNPRVMQRQMGHKNVATTLKYIHFTEDDQRQILDYAFGPPK